VSRPVLTDCVHACTCKPVPTDLLPQALPPHSPLSCPAAPSYAALNLAWSWHEIVADYVRPTLMWLEARGQANLAGLVSHNLWHAFHLFLGCLPRSAVPACRHNHHFHTDPG